MQNYYKVYGLIIRSELPLQGISCPDEGVFDVDVVLNSVPKTLANIGYKGINFESNDHQFLLKVENVGNYLIENASTIIIDVCKDAKNREIELFLLGSAMAALLLQKEIVPFHASAFEYKGEAVLISGISGAGKTTLLQHFVELGYKMLSDDVSALFVKEGKVNVHPSYPSSKIWEDVVEEYGIDISNEDSVRPGISKFRLQQIDHFYNYAIPVKKIIVLSSKNSNHFSNSELQGFDKLKALQSQIYRPVFPIAIGKTEIVFKVLQHLAQQIKLITLERSSNIKLLSSFNFYAESVVLD
ncbi:MAG: hypothetical protein JXR60_04290 [Bacteroidales bacterium]|nr:hypothetical protein [Bacteroidales bacterium]